jgi:uncharacterized membrane protein YhaH (DUF805 family)
MKLLLLAEASRGRSTGDNAMNAYMDAMRRYVDFSGRASRSQFWLYVLFYIIIVVIAVVIDALVFNSFEGGIGVLQLLVALIHLIPSIAISVRRLHDTDRSGWWIFISLVPLIGAIWLLVLYCLDGTQGNNRFGPRPA